MRLKIHKGLHAVYRLAPDSELPPGIFDRPFCCVTRTEDELSIVCAESSLDMETVQVCEPGWRLIEAEGPLDFGLVGVLRSITTPLAEAGISVFAVSTYDTDYLMIKDAHLHNAVKALTRTGFAIG